MVESRANHISVTIKNKLYLVGGLLKSDIEVFDSFSYKFVLLKCSRNLRRYLISDVTTIGNKLVLFTSLDGLVFMYDVENDIWSDKCCEATKALRFFSGAKIPEL